MRARAFAVAALLASSSVAAAGVGDPAPALGKLEGVDGQPVADFSGKVVVLNFFATW